MLLKMGYWWVFNMIDKPNELPRIIYTFLLGCLAGAAIGLGGYAYLVSIALLGAETGKLVGSILFSFGLFNVTFFGYKLYTGKIGYILDKEKYIFLDLLIMLLGNAAGAILLGILLKFITPSESIINAALTCVGSKNVVLDDVSSYFKLILSGAMCGVLVFISVFFYRGFKNPVMKFIGVCFPVIMFVFLSFDHSIANMFYFSFAYSFNWTSFLSVMLVVVGNSIGSIAIYFMFKFLRIRIGE